VDAHGLGGSAGGLRGWCAAGGADDLCRPWPADPAGSWRPALAGQERVKASRQSAPRFIAGRPAGQPLFEVGAVVEVEQGVEQNDRPAGGAEGADQSAQRVVPPPARGTGEIGNGPATGQEIETAIGARPEDDAVRIGVERRQGTGDMACRETGHIGPHHHQGARAAGERTQERLLQALAEGAARLRHAAGSVRQVERRRGADLQAAPAAVSRVQRRGEAPLPELGFQDLSTGQQSAPGAFRGSAEREDEQGGRAAGQSHVLRQCIRPPVDLGRPGDGIHVLAVSSGSFETLPPPFAAAPHSRHGALPFCVGSAGQAAEPAQHLGRRRAGVAAVGAAGDLGPGGTRPVVPLPLDLWQEQRALALRTAGRLDRLGLSRSVAGGERGGCRRPAAFAVVGDGVSVVDPLHPLRSAARLRRRGVQPAALNPRS